MDNTKHRGAARRELDEILKLPADALLVPDEAAAYLRTTRAALSQKRSLGSGPAYLKNGYLIRYRKSSLDAWLEGQSADESVRHRSAALGAAA